MIQDKCVLTLKDDGIHGITSSKDNTMYAYASLEGEYEEGRLNLPSLEKLSKALSMVKEEDITLVLRENHLEYKNDELKFKYHLHEDGVISVPNLTLNKIQSFHFNIEFKLDMDFMASLLQKSSITNTKKLYIYTEDNSLVWKLGDDTAPNSDSICIIGEEVDFDLKPFIMKVDDLKLITKVSKYNNIFKINSKMGIGAIISKNDYFGIQYIFSSIRN